MAADRSRVYRLDAGEGAAAGMRRVALGRLDSAAEQLREAERAVDPSASIHAARKDLKKLRAAIRLLRRELGEELYRAENERYREAGRALAPSRDAEVKVETLEALRERCAGRLAPAVTDEWLAALRQERERALAPGRAGDRIALALATVEQGVPRVEAWPLETESWKLLAPGIDRAYRRGRREMRRAAADPSGTGMHEWRKRVKDLWYQLRILRDDRPEALAESLEQADRLADLLGAHHDLTVLRGDLLGRDVAVPHRPELVAAIGERQAALAAQAFELGGRLYARKPKAFRRKLRRGWKRRRKG
jgi:CHAD domain-containing protein